jgi:hypothetical protein
MKLKKHLYVNLFLQIFVPQIVTGFLQKLQNFWGIFG